MGNFIKLNSIKEGPVLRLSVAKIVSYIGLEGEVGSRVDIGCDDHDLQVRETPEEIDSLIEQAERS